MSDPDPNVTDEDLAAMGHDELVAFLNRLYARCGEPALTVSTARASSDGELRDRIRGARRRVLAQGSERPRAASTGAVLMLAEGGRRTPPRGEDVPARRLFVLFISDDLVLARRARAICGTRGAVLISAASQARVASLVTSVTPTHVVIEGAVQIDEATVRELATRGAQVRWCRGAPEVLDALADIE
ncbi:MAG: hypothetical protein HS111_10095 [Kofleriaceae bacterium]|nr:hypothetical protein [Kofleriaceae bacterium]